MPRVMRTWSPTKISERRSHPARSVSPSTCSAAILLDRRYPRYPMRVRHVTLFAMMALLPSFAMGQRGGGGMGRGGGRRAGGSGGEGSRGENAGLSNKDLE